MRFDEGNPKRIKDYSWVPMLKMLLTPFKDTRDKHVPGSIETSYLNNPHGDLTPDEIDMAKSGASYEDLMFLRAYNNQNERGFSPYFNPNIDHSKKRKK